METGTSYWVCIFRATRNFRLQTAIDNLQFYIFAPLIGKLYLLSTDNSQLSTKTAQVAKLVDALCSGRSVRKDVLVRIQSWAPGPLLKGAFLLAVMHSQLVFQS